MMGNAIKIASKAEILTKKVSYQEQYFVLGVIDFKNIADIIQQAYQCIENKKNPQDRPIEFNFSELKQCNSAALALLTHIMRYAHQKKKQVRFLHLPEKLMQSAQISQLDKILP